MKFLPLTIIPSRRRAGGQLATLRWLAAWMALFLALPALARPTASATLVISQVYGGGGNTGATYTNDFIELHNVSGAAVSLAGYSVQYTSGTGTWSTTALTGSIPAGGYYLIQEAAGNGGTTALPAPTSQAPSA